jgi:hypothetical protein
MPLASSASEAVVSFPLPTSSASATSDIVVPVSAVLSTTGSAWISGPSPGVTPALVQQQASASADVFSIVLPDESQSALQSPAHGLAVATLSSDGVATHEQAPAATTPLISSDVGGIASGPVAGMEVTSITTRSGNSGPGIGSFSSPIGSVASDTALAIASLQATTPSVTSGSGSNEQLTASITHWTSRSKEPPATATVPHSSVSVERAVTSRGSLGEPLVPAGTSAGLASNIAGSASHPPSGPASMTAVDSITPPESAVHLSTVKADKSVESVTASSPPSDTSSSSTVQFDHRSVPSITVISTNAANAASALPEVSSVAASPERSSVSGEHR